MDTMHFFLLAIIGTFSFYFLRNNKKIKKPLNQKSIEEKYGNLHCDGRCCSFNDECSAPERLFCRDVLKKALPNAKYSAQHIVSLPSGLRKIDFAFISSDNKKIAIELDGFQNHAKGLTREKFDLQLKRQNELILDNWQVLRFSFDQLTKGGAAYCIDCIAQLLTSSDPAQVRPCRSIFQDIFYPYEEGKAATDLLRSAGALYSSRRKRWYIPADFFLKKPLPDHWKLTPWTDCPLCRGKAVGKMGRYGSYWQCNDCSKTFNTCLYKPE